jgi:hypothetical protein
MFQIMIKSSLVFVVFLIGGALDSFAVEFRIENRVFLEGKKEPESRSLTLFHEGMVYDFLSEPSEVTVFDKATGHFILLNMAKQEQTELSIAAINAFVEKLTQLANKQKDPSSKFFANPKFEERFDAANGELSLTSPWVRYRLLTEAAENEEILVLYREFSDAYTRLNAMLNPGSRPPQARLQVNDALVQHRSLPREVNLTITSIKNNPPQKSVLRSEHDLNLTLTPFDLDHIHQAREARGKFKVVPYKTYEKNRKSPT